MVAQTTYQNNRPTKLTNLQRRLWAHYDHSAGNFGGNDGVLREITHIAGNRGYSHAKRIDKINEKLSAVKENLSGTERKYAHDLLDISYNYLRETRNTRDKKVRFRREVKDYSSVINEIRDLRMDYQSNSGYRDFVSRQRRRIEEQVAEVEPGIVQYTQNRTQGRDLWSRIRDALKTRRQVVQHPPSRYRMTGSFAIKGLVAVAIIAGAAGVVGHVGDIYRGLTDERDALTQERDALQDNRDRWEKIAFENCTKRNEFRQENLRLIEENKQLKAQNTTLSEKAKAKEVKAASDLYEADQVDKVFSAFVRGMRWPMARATLKDGVWGDMLIMPYDMSTFPEAKEELWDFARRVEIFYDAPNAAEGKVANDEFARFAQEAGVDGAFVQMVADGQHLESLNAAAAMAANFRNSMSKTTSKGLIKTVSPEGDVSVYGTLEQITGLKGGKLGW